MDFWKINIGDFFIVLKGDCFDGNQYVVQVLEKGVFCVVVDDFVVVDGECYLFVEDILKAFQGLGWYYWWQFDILVLGIIGSNGKIIIKELVVVVFS